MKMGNVDVTCFGVADRLERLPVCGYHRWLFMIISLAFFFDNVDLATMTFVLGSIKSEFGLSPAQAGLLGSAGFVGMACGAVCSGMLADRFGRKPVFQISMVVWGIGSLLCYTASDATELGIYRVLLGIGMGMELPLAQTLLSEFIPAKSRGKYLALMDGNWPIAFVCAGLLSYVVLQSHNWRMLFLIESIPALFLFVIRRSVPESPRWLESQRRHEEAEQIVSSIEQTVMSKLKIDTLPPVTLSVDARHHEARGLKVLWSCAYRQRTMMVGVLWFFALLGFYGLNTWLGALLQASGSAVTKSVLFTVYISLGGIPGFLIAAWAVEHWGRKATCVATLLGGAIMTYVFGHAAQWGASSAGLIIAGAGMQFFAFGMWAVLYAYTPELYPSRARATGCGFASFCGRIGALLGPTLIGWLLPVVQQGGVFIFGATCFAIASLVVLRFGVETRGEVLEAVSE
ncbi:MFS transporter [Caballeronia sp. ATUFL_M1_KS5A]|uniref:MFS transporter n=1 Tax=Caballeronia sp. ATUFL_M1_KS5A TaxID=2921778 RepID=UPI002028ABEE|nr:MFS transporter [Caballeronia sp. ATUFL_M1_KS5A]